jgi:hypothetical protein
MNSRRAMVAVKPKTNDTMIGMVVSSGSHQAMHGRMSARGQTRTSSLGAARPLPPSANIGPGGQSVGQAAQFCLEISCFFSHQDIDDRRRYPA